MTKSIKFYCKPLTQDTWQDFEKLFGINGAYWGCWCMYWRCSNKDFEKMQGSERKKEIHQLVLKKEFAPGIIAYQNEIPIGWISVAPRENYVRLVNSRVLKPFDDKPVWSIVCFFIHSEYRGKGVTKVLIQAAEIYAKENGCSVLEAYPIDTAEKINDTSAYVGTVAMFQETGFMKIVETKAKGSGKKRILMRKTI